MMNLKFFLKLALLVLVVFYAKVVLSSWYDYHLNYSRLMEEKSARDDNYNLENKKYLLGEFGIESYSPEEMRNFIKEGQQK